MKLASYQDRGRASFGIVSDRGLIDIPRRLPQLADLQSALRAAGSLDAIRGLLDAPADYQLHDVTFLPTIPRPDKIIGIGLNYRDHAAELGMPIPPYPTVFVRWPNSVVGHLQPVIRPQASQDYDYEAELAVVIGRAGRHIGKADAPSYVAGYTCFNDASLRDWQKHTTQFTPGKNFYHSGSMGPWLTTADEVPDPGALTVRTTINGTRVQDGHTSNLIFDVPTLIEYISTFAQLEVGDVIITGTPAGVGTGKKPPLWMKAGDVVEVEVEGLGVLRNPVVDEG